VVVACQDQGLGGRGGKRVEALKNAHPHRCIGGTRHDGPADGCCLASVCRTWHHSCRPSPSHALQGASASNASPIPAQVSPAHLRGFIYTEATVVHMVSNSRPPARARTRSVLNFTNTLAGARVGSEQRRSVVGPDAEHHLIKTSVDGYRERKSNFNVSHKPRCHMLLLSQSGHGARVRRRAGRGPHTQGGGVVRVVWSEWSWNESRSAPEVDALRKGTAIEHLRFAHNP
jgi:hypothetical protein